MADYSGINKEIGLLANIWMPLTNERFFFKTGFLTSIDKSLTNSTTQQTQNYYKIPLQFQYMFLRYRNSPTFGLGENIFIFSGDKLFMLWPSLNIGQNIKISEKIYLTLDAEAVFSFGFPMSISPFAYSLNLGLSYKF